MKATFSFLVFFTLFITNAKKSNQKRKPRKTQKTYASGDPKWSQNVSNFDDFPAKNAKLRQKRSFFNSHVFLWVFGQCFFMFLSIWGPKMAPRPKRILIIFGYFLDIFRHFSLSRLFQRFWLISHAQDDQEQPKSMENSMEKDDQNPSQGLPKGSKSPLYGRAVAPALPAQFL